METRVCDRCGKHYGGEWADMNIITTKDGGETTYSALLLSLCLDCRDELLDYINNREIEGQSR